MHASRSPAITFTAQVVMAIYVHQKELPVYTEIDARQITTTSKVHANVTTVF